MIFFFPESLCLLLFLFSFLATAGAEKWLIPRLAAAAKQPIYEGGPRWHMKKSGTPTMGGIAFLLVATAAAPLCVFFLRKNGLQNESVSFLLAIGYALLNGMLGVLDDVTKIKRKQNAGMTPMEKLLFQSLFTALFLFGRAKLASGGTAFAFSFGKAELGVLYYPLLFFFLLFFVNAVNLTDGIDGLASSVSYGVGCALLLFSILLGSAAGALLSAILIGATVSFLLFNAHPAKIFMGDTGSLFLGALLAATALTADRPAVLPIAGIFFLLEGFSVLLQVGYYKLTGKRLFLMAPFHHHLEKKGWKESKICLFALFLTFAFCGVAALLI